MRSRRVLVPCSVLLVALVASCLGVLRLAPASGRAAAQTIGSAPLRTGRGFELPGGDFVGYYLAGRRKVYCLSPRAALPRTAAFHAIARYPRLTSRASHELAYAAGRWGDARSRFAAAVESQLLNTIVGNRADVARRSRSVPRAVGRVVSARLAATRRFSGPYRVDLRLPSGLLPGQSATGVIRVRSAAGAAVPGARIELAAARASAPREVRAGPGGVARFRYEATDLGPLRITATAVGLPAAGLLANSPARGEQHMVTAAAAVTRARASATARHGVAGFSASYACDLSCDGRPIVTLRACAAGSAYARRMVWRAGRREVTAAFAPSARTVCRSLSARLADGDRVTGAWQFRLHGGWSRRVAAAGALRIDCPAVPAVTVEMTYDCSHAGLTISSRPDPRHWTVLVIAGALARRIPAAPGHGASFTTSATCSSPTSYTARAGVQRASGAYHFGATAEITTPRQ